MSEEYSYDESEDASLAPRVAALRKLADDTAKKINGKEKCIPTLLIIAVIAPFIIWAMFYFTKPSFVQKKNADGSYQRDNKKVFMWTFIIALVVWACLYLWTYCQGYDKNAFTCFRK